MDRTLSFLVLVFVFGFTSSPACAVTIETVLVGNPGNTPDKNTGGYGQFGAVDYLYRIGTYEVTNAEYAAFLNAKARSDPFELYHPQMSNNNARGGILRNGNSPDYTYAVKPNMGNKPVNLVNFYDAIRFINWLHNGQGTGDTETGAYTLVGGTSIPNNSQSIARNAGAIWFLPSEDEWYKAAYHQPASQGGDNDNYWFFPTRSESIPTIATANSVGDVSNPGVNVANYNSGADWNGQDGYLTTVGSAGSLSASFYGTFDQGGNVWEWNEGYISSQQFGILRGLRGGGAKYGGPEDLTPGVADYQLLDSAGFEYGFRVANIPEPNSIFLGILAFVWIWWQRKSLGPRRIRQRQSSTVTPFLPMER